MTFKISNLTRTQERILFLIAWVVSTLIAIYGTKVSSNANLNSNRANEIAEQELVLAHRPYVVVEPIRFQDTGSYISLKEIEGNLSLNVLFKFTNTGSSIAKNVRASDVYWAFGMSEVKAELERISVSNQIKCSSAGQADLAPGESIIFSLGVVLKSDQKKEVLLNTFKNFESNQFSLPVDLEVYYDSDLLDKTPKTALSIIMTKSEIIRNYSVVE